MAHESFEDFEVAETLNRDYVSVKVDREERPDIDAVYMEVCQALTGSGGWPMTVIMTPDKKPFFAGTYLPKNARYGYPGLTELLGAVSTAWRDDRARLTENGEKISAYMKNQSDSKVGEDAPNIEIIHSAVEQYRRNFDKKWGGFGSAPKFPVPHNLIFLLRYSAFSGDAQARNMAEKTIASMYRGGIYDHIGGGFSRYSTDEKWLVPHFEKMLYDNALMAWACTETYGLTKKSLYRQIAAKTINYVFAELINPKGGFLCGQDADSDGEEGKYYVFTPEEVKTVLGETDGETFCRRFGITEKGNFEGKSIPNLLDCPDFETENRAAAAMAKLMYEYRRQRNLLGKDDKVLTSWNALMLFSLARAARLLRGAKYLVMAKRVRRFIRGSLTDSHGRLSVRWRDGEAACVGLLDDYAFYALALLELYEASFEVSCISEAESIASKMLEFFEDGENGGFFLYAKDAEQLLSRPKPSYDSALPSGNSAAALLLLRLAKMTGEEKWREASERQLRFVAAVAKEYGMNCGFGLIALNEALFPSQELICAVSGEEAPKELNEFVRANARMNMTVLLKTPENQRELALAAPFTEAYPIPESGSMYYLCSEGKCLPSVKSVSELDLKSQV